MKVRRKFNLARLSVDNPYETIEFESSECSLVEECLIEINDAWKIFCKLKAEGKIQ